MLDGFDGQQDGTNAFIFSRYLVPYLNGFYGAAIFVDGDMHVNCDINELLELFDPDYAVQVVKHDYKTKHGRKYIDTPLANDNTDYPRKNWSSVMIFNCAHPANKILTPEFVGDAGGAFLHRFQWLRDDEIGELPREWNHLVGEYEPAEAKLYHHTLGTPGFKHYADCESAKDWNSYLLGATHLEGERQGEVLRRAHWHCQPYLRRAI
jgi:lipopolysaccharide biosynthesis glycosyltransferase